MQLKLTDEDEQSSQKRVRGHRLSLTCVCVDSENKYAYTGAKDGSLIKWSLQTRKILSKKLPINKGEAESDKELSKRFHVKHINCIAISSDSKFLATGGFDKQIRIWSPEDLSWIHTFSKHRREVTALAFRIDHPTLYSGSEDRSVMIWTLEDDDNRCMVEDLYGHESSVTSIDTLRKERVLTSGGRDQTLRVWKIVEGAQTVFNSKHESADIVKFINDQMFVSGGEDGAITIWTTMKRSPLFSLPNAHGSTEQGSSQESSNDVTINQPRLKYWINSLATFSLKAESTRTTTQRPTKRRKLDPSDESHDQDDDVDEEEDRDDDDGDSGGEGEQVSGTNLALIASGSCDSKLKIWILSRKEGKFSLELHQTHECPGFINDLKFTMDGKKIVVACGQEHRFGRWWKLKGASKNNIRIFDVEKIK